MAQRVEFTVLPNTIDQILLDRTVTILAHVAREKPKFKAFRSWLREQNVWKKEETPQALAMFGVKGMDGRGRITLNAFGEKLAAADSIEGRKEILFDHLLKVNPILLKYVVEALDTENDGRLHSTHELYRYITSYAYPGDYIRLVDFQNYMKFLEASGGIRIIGIRWGLDEIGKAKMPKIRQIDVEEILEDEALGEEEEEEEDDDCEESSGASVPAVPAAPNLPMPPTPQPQDPPQQTAATADDGEEEEWEDFPDMPPEAGPPQIDEEAARRFAESMGIDNSEPQLPPVGTSTNLPDPVAAQPAAPAPAAAAAPAPAGAAIPAAVHAPARPERTAMPVAVAPVRPLRTPPLDGGISPQDRLESARKVKAWWGGFGLKRFVKAEDLGFDPATYEADRKRFLLRLMTAAVLIDHEAHDAPVAGFLAKLDEVDAFARIGREGHSLEGILAELNWFADNTWYLRLSENLVHTARFEAQLADVDGVLESLAGQRGGAQVAERVHVDLFGGSYLLPTFWLIREMYRMGLWTSQAFAAVACVPTYRTRLAAFRLGFLDTFYAEGFPRLLQMSQVLSRFFDETCDFNAPLDQLADGYGCQLRCPHVLDCPLSCREKFSV